MPSPRTSKKTSKPSTLTIRIDERLKYDVIAIARESGEDISTWIRRFFEGVRKRKGLGRKSQGTGDDEGTFTPQFIDDVLEADKQGEFMSFNMKDYV